MNELLFDTCAHAELYLQACGWKKIDESDPIAPYTKDGNVCYIHYQSSKWFLDVQYLDAE